MSSSSAASASAPPSASPAKPGSRAAEMQRRRAEAAALAKEREEMIARLAALDEKLGADAPLESTMEASLRKRLDVAHSEVMAAAAADGPDVIEILQKGMYNSDDLLDENFYVSGVEVSEQVGADIKAAVVKGSGLNRQQAQELYAAYLALDVGFIELDDKFIARALLARELKLIYIQQREELKSLRAQLAQVSLSAHESEKKVERVISMAVKITTKSCGCKPHTKCPPQCGCRRSGLGCSDGCGCNLEECQNPNSYPDDEEGRAKLVAAITAAGTRALKGRKRDAVAAKEAAVEAKKAAILAKLEAGQFDQSF